MEHNKSDTIIAVLQSFIDVFDKMAKETEDGTIDYWEDSCNTDTTIFTNPKPQAIKGDDCY